MSKHHTFRPSAVVLLAMAGLAGCAQKDEPVAPSRAPALAVAGESGGAFDVTPLAQSATCTVAGGDPVHPLVLPAGFTQTILASEPAFANDPDMQTLNETGPQAGRFLYRAHEVGSGGSVSVTDLETGETRTLVSRPDWERLDGIVWTPWGTLLTAEETNTATLRDPAVPNAIGGLVYEIDPETGAAVARPALGAKAHEGMRFDPEGNLYGISERNPGFIFKFAPDRRGELSSGQLYALKVTEPTGDRVGEAVWLPLDRDVAQVSADAAAEQAGATGYSRPEDVEIGTSTGNSLAGSDILYVAITGPSGPTDRRVIAVDLREAADGSEHNTAFVYDYVKVGLNVSDGFTFPDNLALDPEGNLYVAEDPGGTFAGGKRAGDDIWMAKPAAGGQHQAAAEVVRFASLTDCDAEPTGIYFDRDGARLFVNVQHRGGDGLDKSVAIQPE